MLYFEQLQDTQKKEFIREGFILSEADKNQNDIFGVTNYCEAQECKREDAHSDER